MNIEALMRIVLLALLSVGPLIGQSARLHSNASTILQQVASGEFDQNPSPRQSVLGGRYYFSNFAALRASGGPAFATALGVVEYHAGNTITYAERVNAGRVIQNAAGAGSYQTLAGGELQVQIARDPPIKGFISAGGHTIVASTILDAFPGLHNFFFAVKAPTSPVSNGFLSGTYSLFQFTAVETIPRVYQAGFGSVTFDGAGRYSANQRVTDGTRIQQLSYGGTYQLNPDGTGTFTTTTNGISLTALGAVSADGNTLIGNVLLQPGYHSFLIAVKRASQAVSTSDVNGHYAFIEFNRLPGDSFLSGIGISYADGAGRLETSEFVNLDGTIAGAGGTANYTVQPSGDIQITYAQGTPTVSGAVLNSSSDFIGTTISPATLGLFNFVFGIRLSPWIAPDGIVNGASFERGGLAPGSIASIFGFHFGPFGGAAGGLIPGTSRLASTINRLAVTLDGVPAPLFFVNFTQINVQVPFEIISGRSEASVVVTVNGVASEPVAVRINPAAPGIFAGSSGSAIAVHSDGRLVDANNRARVGETVVLFVTGLGSTSPPTQTGVLFPGIAQAVASTNVFVGGSAAKVTYAGATPGFVGLYQINLEVPDIATGNYPVIVMSGDFESNRPILPVER